MGECPMRSVSNIQAEAASKAINKWVRKFEEAFCVKAEGKKPVQKMKSIISEIEKKIGRLEKKSRKRRRKKA